MPATFVEAVASQCRLLTHASKRLDEAGYMVLVHGLNRDTLDGRFMYGHIAGGLESFGKMWARARGLTLVTVDVWPYKDDYPAIRESGKPFDHGFSSTTTLRLVRRYKPIIAALEIVSARMEAIDPEERRKRLKEAKRYRNGTGVLTMEAMPEEVKFYGSGRPALEVIMRILNMPDHRHLLTGGAFKVVGGKHYHMIDASGHRLTRDKEEQDA